MTTQVGAPGIQAAANMIQHYVTEKFRDGQRVDILLGIDRPLNEAQTALFQQKLLEGGLELAAPVEFGTHPAQDYVVHLQFVNHATEGIAMLPLAVLIIAAAGAVGVAAILGWQVGQAVSAIGRAVIPLALIAGGVYVLSRFVEAKYKT